MECQMTDTSDFCVIKIILNSIGAEKGKNARCNFEKIIQFHLNVFDEKLNMN